MSNLIDRAADRLRGRWHQGGWTDHEGNVCVMGALCIGADQIEAIEAAITALNDVARAEFGINAIEYNDHRSTSEEDVLLLMKKASALLDERMSS